MRWKLLILSSLVAVVGACADNRDPFAPSAKVPGASNDVPAAILDCVGTLAGGPGALGVTCTPATVDGPAAMSSPKIRAMIAAGVGAQSVTLGRQNIDVTLAFSNYAFSGGVFSASVTVQNLLNQTLGDTTSGATSNTGTRVFFVNNPPVAVTSGTGTATIAAPDTGTFTGSFQPYFPYAAIAPNATSAPSTWKFNLSSGVKGFTFSVEISTTLAAEKSIRRWTTLTQGVTSNNLTGAWRHTSSDVYAVGVNGALLDYNGTTWAAVGTGLSSGNNYRGVSGVAGQTIASVWAVGDNGVAVHDTNGTWSSVPTGQSSALYGVWVAGAGNVYAVGNNGLVMHYSGSVWKSMTSPTSSTLRAVWGSDATHIWAVGDNGTVIFGNGTTWVTDTSNTTQGLTGVWGDAANDIYAVGGNGTIIHLTNANTDGKWSVMLSGSTSALAAIGGSAATDIWAVGGNGTTLHYNGSVWLTIGPNTGIPLTGVTTGSSSAIWAVGAQGSLLSSTGSAWQVSMQSGLTYYSVWASSATDVYVSSLGTVLHYNGSQWTNAYVSPADSMDCIWGAGPLPQLVYTVGENGNVGVLTAGIWTTTNYDIPIYTVWGPNTAIVYGGAAEGIIGLESSGFLQSFFAGTSANVQGIWGSSVTNVYEVSSDGTISNFKGVGNWNQMTTPSGSRTLYAVSGSSGTDVYAVGSNGSVLHNTGTNSWVSQTSNTSVTLRDVWADSPASGYSADAYAVGDNGTVQHYNGSTWINMPAPVSTRFRSVYGTSATNLYVVGDNGVVLLGTQ